MQKTTLIVVLVGFLAPFMVAVSAEEQVYVTTRVLTANTAMTRPRVRGGTHVGMVRIEGIPAAMEIAAAQPAWDADKPLSSRILGSQLENPWLMAKASSPMISRILTSLI